MTLENYPLHPLPRTSSHRNTPGIVGLALAVTGSIFSWLPLVWIIAVPMMIAAFILGIIGVFRAGETKWEAAVAIILSVVALTFHAVTFAIMLFFMY